MNFYFILNLAGVIIFLGIAILLSKNKKDINWVSIGLLLAINLLLAWFLLTVPVGRQALNAVIEVFADVINAAQQGVTFAFGDAFSSVSEQLHSGAVSLVFFASALLPILVIVPIFDILTYFGILPFITKCIGWLVSAGTRQPKFESFFAILMMFLGNTEAIAASRYQLNKFNGKSETRILTIAMMSMSCVTASLIGAYCSMLPGEYILTAIPLNVINSLMITSILNPVKISKEEDTIIPLYKKGQKKDPFFEYLGNSILSSGQLVLIICANVIAFVGIAAVINLILGLANPLIHEFVYWDLSLENILGIIMYIPACLLGNPVGSPETMLLATSMGTKLVTNEFVVMGQLQPVIEGFSAHFQCTITVFLTSFANFSTVGMIIGCFNKNKIVAKNVPYLLASGILVSLMSASIAGLFVW